jgi:hypothetical protein
MANSDVTKNHLQQCIYRKEKEKTGRPFTDMQEFYNQLAWNYNSDLFSNAQKHLKKVRCMPDSAPPDFSIMNDFWDAHRELMTEINAIINSDS